MAEGPLLLLLLCVLSLLTETLLVSSLLPSSLKTMSLFSISYLLIVVCKSQLRLCQSMSTASSIRPSPCLILISYCNVTLKMKEKIAKVKLELKGFESCIN